MKFLILGLILFSGFGVSYGSPVQLGTNGNCTICEIIVDILVGATNNAEVDELVELLVTAVCTIFQIEDYNVCSGIVVEFGPEFFYILQNLVKQDPRNLCGFLLPKQCGYTFDPSAERWPMKMPGIKPEHKDTPLPTQNKTLKVLHLSDIHIDTQYTPGMEANCSEPQCCRVPNNMHEFLDTSPAPIIEIPASYWGTIASCDLPYWTAEAMLQHISTNHQDIDYVVVSGDLESHAVWTYNTIDHEYMIKNVSGLLKKYFPNTNVYFALGNHEGVPIDNYAPHWVPKGNLSYQVYDTIYEAWSSWVPSDQEAVVKYRGCYMVKLYPGLRLISLNNGYGDPENL